MSKYAVVSVVFLAIFGLCCFLWFDASSNGLRKAEAWAQSPTEEWPLIVLQQRAKFKGHTGLRRGAAFLVEVGDDGVLVAGSSSLLLGEDGKVTPELSRAEIDAKLVSWDAWAPADRDSTISFTGLFGLATLYGDADVVFLKLDPSLDADSSSLPVKPLKIQKGMLKRYQEVVIVTHSRGKQQIIKGTLPGIPSPFGGTFDITIEPSANPDPWIGAPVLDLRGHLVGILRGPGDFRDDEGKTRRLEAEMIFFKELFENS